MWIPGQIRHFTLLLLSFALMLCPSEPVFATSVESFEQGIQAFNQEKYTLALSLFKRAERKGVKSATLYYNLGSTYYKLGQYAEANQAFTKVIHDGKWATLALYNLGLIAENSGKLSVAYEYYSKAYKKASSEKEIQLTSLKLNRLRSRLQPLEDMDWHGFLSAGAGRDDNVSLADNSVAEIINGELDNFVEFIGATSRYLVKSGSSGTHLDLGAYIRRYQDFNEFNFSTYLIGIGHNRRAKNWQFQIGVKLDTSFANGDSFSSSGIFHFQSSTKFKATGLKFINDYRLVGGASTYDQLSGYSNLSKLEFNWPSSKGMVRLGYIYETNDREDLDLGTEFQSYSPTRKALYVAMNRHITNRWQVNANIEFRNSHYKDVNIQLNLDSSFTIDTRDDERMTIVIRNEYALGPGGANSEWFTFIEYRYTDNDSNFDRYGYTGSVLTFGMQNLF